MTFDSVVTLDRLYPAGVFFCARTTRKMMRWNVGNAQALPQYRLDATPAQLVGFAGAMPFVAHEAAVTPLARNFIVHCGLPGAGDLHTYQTEQDALEVAKHLIRRGGKLVHNFGTLPGLETGDGMLLPIDEHLRLNAKVTIDEFVSEQHLPRRTRIVARELESYLASHLDGPVFVKVAGAVSSGGGAGVWHCTDIESNVKAVGIVSDRMKPGDQLIVETDCQPLHSWCAGISILDAGVTWLGASRQVFHSPARQAGNELTGEPPTAIKELAVGIAERARSRGYRGIAGFDIGEIQDAHPVVFDLNFRPNSSTGLLLAGRAALNRTSLPLARTFHLRHQGPLEQLLDAVEPEAAAGRIIPGSVFDAETYRSTTDDPATRSCLDGWLLAETGEEAAAYPGTVAARLKSRRKSG